jgi:hypothetical protein
MGRETFVVLAGGRRPPTGQALMIAGDQELALRILSGMAITP